MWHVKFSSGFACAWRSFPVRPNVDREKTRFFITWAMTTRCARDFALTATIGRRQEAVSATCVLDCPSLPSIPQLSSRGRRTFALHKVVLWVLDWRIARASISAGGVGAHQPAQHVLAAFLASLLPQGLSVPASGPRMKSSTSTQALSGWKLKRPCGCASPQGRTFMRTRRMLFHPLLSPLVQRLPCARWSGCSPQCPPCPQPLLMRGSLVHLSS